MQAQVLSHTKIIPIARETRQHYLRYTGNRRYYENFSRFSMTLSAKSAPSNIKFQVFVGEDVSEQVCHRFLLSDLYHYDTSKYSVG